MRRSSQSTGGGRHGWREERVRSPDVVDVCSPEPSVFEQVGGLAVDLEGVLVIESINIEQLVHDRWTGTAWSRDPAPHLERRRDVLVLEVWVVGENLFPCLSGRSSLDDGATGDACKVQCRIERAVEVAVVA